MKGVFAGAGGLLTVALMAWLALAAGPLVIGIVVVLVLAGGAAPARKGTY